MQNTPLTFRLNMMPASCSHNRYPAAIVNINMHAEQSVNCMLPTAKLNAVLVSCGHNRYPVQYAASMSVKMLRAEQSMSCMLLLFTLSPASLTGDCLLKSL